VGVPSHRDEVRLLGKTGSYTHDPSRALRSGGDVEPEAVPRDVQDRFTDAAHRDAAVLREQQVATRASVNGFGSRIALAKAEAKLRGVDVHSELRMVRLVVQGGRSERQVERAVTKLERRVWPPLNDH
jgi:hypothetical protein